MDDATRALEQLNAGRLEMLAAELEALLASPARLTVTPGIAARQRVFASVVQATGHNLKMLQRLALTAGEETRWAL